MIKNINLVIVFDLGVMLDNSYSVKMLRVFVNHFSVIINKAKRNDAKFVKILVNVNSLYYNNLLGVKHIWTNLTSLRSLFKEVFRNE